MAKEVSKLICGIASFFIPGLGQLLDGRIKSAIFWFLLILALWALLMPHLGRLGYIVVIIAWFMNVLDAVR